MLVNVNNVDRVECGNRDEAVKVIKDRMGSWMNPGDKLGWYRSARAIRARSELPDVAIVLDSDGERTDDFAIIE